MLLSKYEIGEFMKRLRQYTLLCAENNFVSLSHYKKFFTNAFEHVINASNGLEAWENYLRYKPDVIILDMQMAYLNGVELVRKIREKDNITDIILMSEKIDKETLFNIIELKLTTYLEKPLSKKSILSALAKIAVRHPDVSILNNDINYTWNKNDKSLFYRENLVKLTKSEIKLFSLFMKNSLQILSCEDIYNEVCTEGNKEFSKPAIKTLIQNLRKKLPLDTIRNVYGIGYSICKFT